VHHYYTPRKMPSGSISGGTSPPQVPASAMKGESAMSAKGAAPLLVADMGAQPPPLLRMLERRCKPLGPADAMPPPPMVCSPARERVVGDLMSPLSGEYCSARSESERSMPWRLEPSPQVESSRINAGAGEFCDKRGENRVPMPADG